MTATESAAAPRSGAATRLAAGVVLLLVAIVVFAASRLVAAGQSHAYDPGTSPPPSYNLTAGTTYQLSSSTPVAELKKAALLGNLSCSATSGGAEQQPVTVLSTMDDDRDLHVFATARVATTGDLHVSCTGISEVFIDDADNAAPDRSAVLMLLATGLALLGVIAACSGGYELAAERAAAERGSEAAASEADATAEEVTAEGSTTDRASTD
jgi:hypothetical protein